MIRFPFKVGAFEPIRWRMAQDTDPKSDSLDELREQTRILAAWRAGALVRIARKQTERVLTRTRRRSGEHLALLEQTVNRHHGR